MGTPLVPVVDPDGCDMVECARGIAESRAIVERSGTGVEQRGASWSGGEWWGVSDVGSGEAVRLSVL